MQTITVSNAAGVNRNVIVDRIQRNRAPASNCGVVHLGQKPQEDSALARAARREQLKQGVKDRVMTVNFAVAEAAIAGIADLPGFRMELLHSLPIFKGMTDVEIEKRLAVTGKLVNIAA